MIPLQLPPTKGFQPWSQSGAGIRASAARLFASAEVTCEMAGSDYFATVPVSMHSLFMHGRSLGKRESTMAVVVKTNGILFWGRCTTHGKSLLVVGLGCSLGVLMLSHWCCFSLDGNRSFPVFRGAS